MQELATGPPFVATKHRFQSAFFGRSVFSGYAVAEIEVEAEYALVQVLAPVPVPWRVRVHVVAGGVPAAARQPASVLNRLHL